MEPGLYYKHVCFDFALSETYDKCKRGKKKTLQKRLKTAQIYTNTPHEWYNTVYNVSEVVFVTDCHS